MHIIRLSVQRDCRVVVTMSSSKTGFSHAANSRARAKNKYFFMVAHSLAYIIHGNMEKQRIKTDFTDFHGLFIFFPSNLEEICEINYNLYNPCNP